MLTVTVVARPDGRFELRTPNGFPVGNRMISTAPEPGRAFPPEQTVFDSKPAASRAAAEWIVYLAAAKKRKQRKGD